MHLLVNSYELRNVMLDRAPLRPQQSCRSLPSCSWSILVVMLHNPLPKCPATLPIPNNWVLRDAQEAPAHLPLFLAGENFPLLLTLWFRSSHHIPCWLAVPSRNLTPRKKKKNTGQWGVNAEAVNILTWFTGGLGQVAILTLLEKLWPPQQNPTQNSWGILLFRSRCEGHPITWICCMKSVGPVMSSGFFGWFGQKI